MYVHIYMYMYIIHVIIMITSILDMYIQYTSHLYTWSIPGSIHIIPGSNCHSVYLCWINTVASAVPGHIIITIHEHVLTTSDLI